MPNLCRWTEWDNALAFLRVEREHQDKEWGEQNHEPAYWLAILVEEVGEAAKEIVDYNPYNLRNELVQIAAVAIAAIESLERNELKYIKGSE